MADTLHLSRWTVNAGSNARSRAAVVIVSGDHEWQASAEGNGAIDALYKAVDQAVAGVLSGNPRLLAFDIHALGEGSDTVGEVKVRIAPPEREGARGSGEYLGQARGDRSWRLPSRRTSRPSMRSSPRSTGRVRRMRPATAAGSA